MGLARLAHEYGLAKTETIARFSDWTSLILEVRKGEKAELEISITEEGAEVRLNPDYDRKSERLMSVEMHEDGETELEAIAKIGLRVLLKKAHRDEQAKLVVTQAIPT